MNPITVINESDIHHHLRERMLQRGVSLSEIREAINKGSNATDSKEGTYGKVFVFPYNAYWKGDILKRKRLLCIISIKIVS